ncbi:hypothetical protein FH972_014607 [Carpinus fangiana]|uniref:Uncharacterized protein n=1 Tax=Carpinus fangiana TaxID=176857 RepID=A0A5N6RC41_9ROSI|nr:hypothetical protein FH972_014607 [Carpinus fangiana]
MSVGCSFCQWRSTGRERKRLRLERLQRSVQGGEKERASGFEVDAASQWGKVMGQSAIGEKHGNLTKKEEKKKSEKQTEMIFKKKSTGEGENSDGKGEKQKFYQEQIEIIPKVGQRAIRRKEDGIVLDGLPNTQLGKRKGDLELLDGDDFRHLKIHK